MCGIFYHPFTDQEQIYCAIAGPWSIFSV